MFDVGEDLLPSWRLEMLQDRLAVSHRICVGLERHLACMPSANICLLANNNCIEQCNYRFLQSFHCGTVSNTYAEVARAHVCANHMQYNERLSCATCFVPRGMKGELLTY